MTFTFEKACTMLRDHGKDIDWDKVSWLLKGVEEEDKNYVFWMLIIGGPQAVEQAWKLPWLVFLSESGKAKWRTEVFGHISPQCSSGC